MDFYFLALYRFFENRKKTLFISLAFLTAVLLFLASKVSFQEDIMRFIPNTAESEDICSVFGNLKVKDKIVLLVSEESKDIEQTISASEEIVSELKKDAWSYIDDVAYKIDAEQFTEMCDLIFDNLPIYISSSDYARIDSILSDKIISEKADEFYTSLMSPSSIFTADYIKRDPIGISSNAMSKLKTLQVKGDYEIISDYIFSKKDSSLLITISPTYPASNTNANNKFVEILEKKIAQCKDKYPKVRIDYFGGPVISVYNSRQIQQDIYNTMSIALVIISLMIVLSFRRKKSIIYIFLPVLFGGLFAMSMIYLIKGSVSLIAIGAGSAVLGVVLSYSIHVVAHREHINSNEDLIKEMVTPLTIGSFTTIGAFFSLTFTHSDVLSDFGWFASLSIIGTTTFCLVFLPHFFGNRKEVHTHENAYTKLIDKINNYPFDQSKILIALIIILSAVGLYFSNDIKFNPDMNSLSYQPEEFQKTEKKLDMIFRSDDTKNVYFVAVGDNEEEAISNYEKMNRKIAEATKDSLVNSYHSAEELIIKQSEQEEKIKAWNTFWTDEKILKIENAFLKSGEKFGISTNTLIEPFIASLRKKYKPIEISKTKQLNNWITTEQGTSMAISQVRLKEENKEEIYNRFKSEKGIVILDKPYFISNFMNVINDDFNFVLYISSLIVFLALLLSYGRLELAMLSFLPMTLSWFIILALMKIFGLEFNIVSIIISTFIFGIGDDFSIFITDGLLSEYKYRKKTLPIHKNAIFFSAFTTIVGMGALVFAKHPSLQSVSATSLIGMFAVVLIAYTVQPLLFRLFITSRTKKGNPPASIISLFFTILSVGTFVTCAIAASIIILLLKIIPLPSFAKEKIIHILIMTGCKLTVLVSLRQKVVRYNPDKEKFRQSAIIIANHQSVIDIINILSYSPNIVMMVKEKIYNHPIIGFVVRSANFCCVTDGYENSLENIKELTDKGYCVTIFPEGKRSADGTLDRFHKGAFYIAEKLHLDIIPIIMTGNHNAITKGDLMMLKPAYMTFTVCSRISASDSSWGNSYQERRKSISAHFKEKYKKLSEENDPKSFAEKYRLTRNFIYKGPVLEWYLRVKIAMEKNYVQFDKIIPKAAKITDIGCGYGFLTYMLHFYSNQRVITGIDYDEEKICVAQNCFSKNDKIKFIAENSCKSDLENCDVFILNDMLHYMPYDEQEALIEKCMNSLNSDGMIIIRDGNSTNQEKHKITKLTEFLSTKIFRFNKTENSLFYTSEQRITEIAKRNIFLTERHKNDDVTSNEIFILRKS